MTEHVTPEEARRHANALNVLGTHPHLESARQLRSLAAQVEELRRLIGTATDGEEVLRRLAEQNSSLASQVEELTAQVEQMQAVVETAREIADYGWPWPWLQRLRKSLAAFDEKGEA